MNEVWICIVENSGAKLLATKGKRQPIRVIRQFRHPAGKQKGYALTTDRPGRKAGLQGAGRHALGKTVSPAAQERKKFVRGLSLFLKKNFDEHSFAKLVLVAPPVILGELRRQLPEKLKETVQRELIKEYPSWLSENRMLQNIKKDLEL